MSREVESYSVGTERSVVVGSEGIPAVAKAAATLEAANGGFGWELDQNCQLELLSAKCDHYEAEYKRMQEYYVQEIERLRSRDQQSEQVSIFLEKVCNAFAEAVAGLEAQMSHIQTFRGPNSLHIQAADFSKSKPRFIAAPVAQADVSASESNLREELKTLETKVKSNRLLCKRVLLRAPVWISSLKIAEKSSATWAVAWQQVISESLNKQIELSLAPKAASAQKFDQNGHTESAVELGTPISAFHGVVTNSPHNKSPAKPGKGVADSSPLSKKKSFQQAIHDIRLLDAADTLRDTTGKNKHGSAQKRIVASIEFEKKHPNSRFYPEERDTDNKENAHSSGQKAVFLENCLASSNSKPRQSEVRSPSARDNLLRKQLHPVDGNSSPTRKNGPCKKLELGLKEVQKYEPCSPEELVFGEKNQIEGCTKLLWSQFENILGKMRNRQLVGLNFKEATVAKAGELSGLFGQLAQSYKVLEEMSKEIVNCSDEFKHLVKMQQSLTQEVTDLQNLLQEAQEMLSESKLQNQNFRKDIDEKTLNIVGQKQQLSEAAILMHLQDQNNDENRRSLIGSEEFFNSDLKMEKSKVNKNGPKLRLNLSSACLPLTSDTLDKTHMTNTWDLMTWRSALSSLCSLTSCMLQTSSGFGSLLATLSRQVLANPASKQAFKSLSLKYSEETHERHRSVLGAVRKHENEVSRAESCSSGKSDSLRQVDSAREVASKNKLVRKSEKAQILQSLNGGVPGCSEPAWLFKQFSEFCQEAERLVQEEFQSQEGYISRVLEIFCSELAISHPKPPLIPQPLSRR